MKCGMQSKFLFTGNWY